MVKRIQILLLSLLATGASHAASAQFFGGAFIDDSLEISAEPEATVQEGNEMPERIISVRRFIALNTSAIKNDKEPNKITPSNLANGFRDIKVFEIACGVRSFAPSRFLVSCSL